MQLTPLKLFIVIVLVCTSVFSSAEQKKTLGDWDVHYIVIPTTFLTPEIARANDITRSRFNALVNISVLNKNSQQAQNASVTGNARNLIGTTKPLNFKKVTEGKAIYYLATVNFDDKEVLRFTIDIQQGNTSQQLKFQQKMYAD